MDVPSHQREGADHERRDQDGGDACGPLDAAAHRLPGREPILHETVTRVADLTELRLLPVEAATNVVTESHQMSSSRSPGLKRLQAR